MEKEGQAVTGITGHRLIYLMHDSKVLYHSTVLYCPEEILISIVDRS